MSTPATGVQEWRDIPWPKAERNVHRLQKRIYQASQRGEARKVHRLQRLLLSSWSAKCLAVRRVTQDNQGKKTAGVDGVAALEPEQRLDLVAHLNLDARPQPIRRAWIPKPGADEQRPLGIPTLSDRARQALVKLALEPEWEARFEGSSYSFRPGRGCQDAIGKVYQICRPHMRKKWALDADIKGAFDNIDHDVLRHRVFRKFDECCGDTFCRQASRRGIPQRQGRNAIGIDVLRAFFQFGKGTYSRACGFVERVVHF